MASLTERTPGKPGSRPVFHRAFARTGKQRRKPTFTRYSEQQTLPAQCAWCSRWRHGDAKTGEWKTEAPPGATRKLATHSICPECAKVERGKLGIKEDTFVRVEADPALDIPKHHELLTRYGFQYLDAMPESLEGKSDDIIHSYMHERGGNILVSSSGAWNLHTPHGQEEIALPGPGTWLPLETVLRRAFEPVVESAAILHHYYEYYPVEYYPQDMPGPIQPTAVEQTVDSVLAGLSTREAIHKLVNKETAR